MIKQKDDSSINKLGYSCVELREHIINHSNWNFVKNGLWELDHIYPIKAFIDYGISDIKIINCLDNLQPLSKTDNHVKRAIYNKHEFEMWLKGKHDKF